MTGVPVGLRGDEAALFERYTSKLARIVARQVRTSSVNIDDACSFAWLQMLRYQPARDTLLSWLVRTGTREAVKLDRRVLRDDELPESLDDSHCATSAELPIEAHIEILAARDAITVAGLRAREAEILAAHLAGYSYPEIAHAKRITVRTVLAVGPAGGDEPLA